MPVPVSRLWPPLSTVLTLEGLFLSVEAQVIVKTAQLFELLAAHLACQDLIHPLRDAVTRVGDRVIFELSHLEPIWSFHLLQWAALKAVHACEYFMLTCVVLGPIKVKVGTFISHNWHVIIVVNFIYVLQKFYWWMLILRDWNIKLRTVGWNCDWESLFDQVLCQKKLLITGFHRWLSFHFQFYSF